MVTLEAGVNMKSATDSGIQSAERRGIGETMKERIARALGCLILAVAVAGRAGGLSGYSKTGVSDQQKSTDYYECQRDSSVLVSRAKGMPEHVPDTEKLNACMRAREYEVL
jgi:hypothetical protein